LHRSSSRSRDPEALEPIWLERVGTNRAAGDDSALLGSREPLHGIFQHDMTAACLSIRLPPQIEEHPPTLRQNLTSGN
jgi:hypothetical protein